MISALLMSFEPIRFELMDEFGAELPGQHPAEREGCRTRSDPLQPHPIRSGI
jgi:hypothetical protein